MSTPMTEERTPPADDMAGINLKPSQRKHGALDLTPQANNKTVGTTTVDNAIISARNVNVFYGDKHAIKNVTLDIGRNQVIGMIAPSGCGKSTFLRCLNRMTTRWKGARGRSITMEDPTLRPEAGVVQCVPG